jgi:hypothetical protein
MLLQFYVLVNQLQNETTDVRIGCGSFIEKPIVPFADNTKPKPYAFRHTVNLTTNISDFVVSYHYKCKVYIAIRLHNSNCILCINNTV